MSNNVVIKLEKASKRFPLFSNRSERFQYHFPFLRRLWRHSALSIPHKEALNGIDLQINKGEKVGIIGSNGSGKTTLLNLIIGYSSATEGLVSVRGSVQALMQNGLGFVEDISGLENVKNALHLNGLNIDQRAQALADVIDFVELGDFINYPFKTYSLGMRARLEFATATAIFPDILVIDEVLGAGDGYFAKKCAERMKNLVKESTLLLVSHSMGQIYDFCDRVIWVNQGKVVDDGDPERVIKSYEKHMAKEEATIQASIRKSDANAVMSASDAIPISEPAINASMELLGSGNNCVEQDLKILSVGFDEDFSKSLMIETGDPLKIYLTIAAKHVDLSGLFPIVYGFSEHGSLIWKASGKSLDTYSGTETVKVELSAERFIGGIGNYHLTISVEEIENSPPCFNNLTDVIHTSMYLKVMETNYSDPPFVHCPGSWQTESSIKPSRICAWV